MRVPPRPRRPSWRRTGRRRWLNGRWLPGIVVGASSWAARPAPVVRIGGDAHDVLLSRLAIGIDAGLDVADVIGARVGLAVAIKADHALLAHEHATASHFHLYRWHCRRLHWHCRRRRRHLVSSRLVPRRIAHPPQLPCPPTAPEWNQARRVLAVSSSHRSAWSSSSTRTTPRASAKPHRARTVRGRMRQPLRCEWRRRAALCSRAPPPSPRPPMWARAPRAYALGLAVGRRRLGRNVENMRQLISGARTR